MKSVVLVLGPNPRCRADGTIHPTDEDALLTVAIPQHPERSRLLRDMLETVAAEAPPVEVGSKRARDGGEEGGRLSNTSLVDTFVEMDLRTSLLTFHTSSYIDVVRRCNAPHQGMAPLSTLVAPVSIYDCIAHVGVVGRPITYEDLVDAGLADEIPQFSDGDTSVSEEEYIPSLSLRVDTSTAVTVPLPVYEMASCHPFACIYPSSTNVVKGALTAVHHLLQKGVSVAMYPFGGRHHAQSDRASGFCVFNDVVIAVTRLHSEMPSPNGSRRILIIDIDAHHGDGTEAAFSMNPDITTLSCHAYGPGYFPGEGASSTPTAVNIPLPLGSGDEAVPSIIETIQDQFVKVKWHACVLVAGTDAVMGDPLGGLNLSIAGWRALSTYVMRCCRSSHCKLLVLGSGGYVDVTASRCWAALLRDADREFSPMPSEPSPPKGLDVSTLPQLPNDVPSSLEYFSRYGPTFYMDATPPCRIARPAKTPTLPC